MKQKCIYLLWLFVYIICVGLGTLYEDILVLQIFQGLFAVLFFVPPVQDVISTSFPSTKHRHSRFGQDPPV